MQNFKPQTPYPRALKEGRRSARYSVDVLSGLLSLSCLSPCADRAFTQRVSSSEVHGFGFRGFGLRVHGFGVRFRARDFGVGFRASA